MENAKALRITLVISILLCLSAHICPAQESDLASDYLCEYGIKLHKEGNIEDAIHELKKSLIVNPDNCTARNYLRQIIFQDQLPAGNQINLSFAAPYSNCPNQKIIFYASLNQDYPLDDISYRWDFGDGTGAEGTPNISHIYEKGGKYLVKVFAGDRCGYGSKALNININTPPIVDAGPNLACCAEKESVFDASSSSDADGDSLGYKWDFGDGDTAYGSKVTHRYSQPGEYAVTLVVTDNSGTPCNSSKDSFTAKVAGNPVAVIKIN